MKIIKHIYKCLHWVRNQSPIAQPAEPAKAQEGCPTFNSTIVNYRLKWYATEDSIATVDEDIRTFKK